MKQSIFQRALGAVKDKTSIGLARVYNARNVPSLEIAIVKATCHDESTVVEEQHILEIVQLSPWDYDNLYFKKLMSFSRGYAGICVSLLERRLKKTRNWIVALKVLVVIHKLLLHDSTVVDCSFDDELMLASRRMLSLKNFSDDGFIRNYALYIDEWLDIFAASHATEHNYVETEQIVIDYNDYKTDYNTLFQQQDSSDIPNARMNILLKRIPVLQHLLEHVLLTCSSGVDIPHTLVKSAISLVLRDSFAVYMEVCDGVCELLNEFFLMARKDGLKAYSIYKRLAKQAELLGEVYENCRKAGICRDGEYPSIQKVSSEHLVLLEDYLKDTKIDETDSTFNKQESLSSNSGTSSLGASSEKETTPSSTNNLTEEWEVILMDEAKKLSYSLSMGRNISLFTDWSLSKSTNSRITPAPQQRLRSMSAVPAFGDGEIIYQNMDVMSVSSRIGVGSPGSYGRLMNKHYIKSRPIW